ncbi:hypothetical protein H6G36_14280 [Anabaena minutissima FACHB-250]|nr:hypothetical protein [Anabaena minutissima FACHB-250]
MRSLILTNRRSQFGNVGRCVSAANRRYRSSGKTSDLVWEDGEVRSLILKNRRSQFENVGRCVSEAYRRYRLRCHHRISDRLWKIRLC